MGTMTSPAIAPKPAPSSSPEARRDRPLRVKVLVTAAAVLAGWLAGNGAMSWFRREPGVAKNLLSRPWVSGEIGQSSVHLDTPFRLEGVAVPFPKEFAGSVSQWTWLGREEGGIHVMTGRVLFAHGVQPNLEGAADGMVRNVEALPGTKSVATRKWDTKLLGSRAIEVEMRIARLKGDPLLMHGVVVLVRRLELVQLLSIARADQPAATEAWSRMRDSMRIE
jgi:hypothetical protein